MTCAITAAPSNGLGARTFVRGVPAKASGSSSADARQASTASSAPWVVRDCSAAVATRRGRSRQNRRATGASASRRPPGFGKRPVPDAVGVLRWNRRRVSGALRHVGFLVLRFDGSRPHVAHAADRVVRACAQFRQQAGGDRSGASQTATAVDKHVEAQPQPVPQGFPRDLPSVLEAPCRRRPPIPDRQVPPLHRAGSNFASPPCLAGRRHSHVVRQSHSRLLPTPKEMLSPKVAPAEDKRGRAHLRVRIQVPSATTTPSCARAVLVSVSSWANAASVRNGVQSVIRSAKR